MATPIDLETWLRETCTQYSFDLFGIYRSIDVGPWPMTFKSANELDDFINAGTHLLPLPKESAALANVLEVSVADFLLQKVSQLSDLEVNRGSERGYPDLEFTGAGVGDTFTAVDIKVARRKKTRKGVSKNTNSRITLYTGNTYFRHPEIHWAGTFRPFREYSAHLDVLVIYTLNEDSNSRVDDLEIIVQPTWKIASKQRSSTTREYIGAVMDIDDLRSGKGEFSSQNEFYTFWRKYPFKTGKIVEDQLRKLLSQQQP